MPNSDSAEQGPDAEGVKPAGSAPEGRLEAGCLGASGNCKGPD